MSLHICVCARDKGLDPGRASSRPLKPEDVQGQLSWGDFTLDTFESQSPGQQSAAAVTATFHMANVPAAIQTHDAQLCLL